MSESKNQWARMTFAERANDYEQETGWVTSPELLNPLVPFRRDIADAKSGRFLDVCTGTGQVAKLASERGWIAVAIDQSTEMLKKASSSNILAIQINASQLPFARDSFDVTAIRQALHYFDTATMIKQLFYVSRCEVRLGHITTYAREDVALWSEYFETASPGRLNVFSPGEIKRVIEELGGEVIREDILHSVEYFDGPIEHLGAEVAEKLRLDFLAGDPDVVSKYIHSEDDDGRLRIKLRWEFQTVRVP